MRIQLILFLSLLFSPVAHARMYQWVDPDTGTTQLSGKPPIWYRSSENGPRIIVIEQGKVIDDTAIKLPDGQREMLRQNAFLKVEEDRAEATRKAQEAARLKSALAPGQGGDVDMERQTGEPVDMFEKFGEFDTDSETVEMIETDEEAIVKEMREKIEEWERQRTEEAKKLIDLEPDT